MDFQELERLNLMIKATPRNPDAYFYRGYFYLEHDQLSKALLDFSKAIELKPNHFNAYLYKTIGLEKFKQNKTQTKLNDKVVLDQVFKQKNFIRTTKSVGRNSTGTWLPKIELDQASHTNMKFFSKPKQIISSNLIQQNKNSQIIYPNTNQSKNGINNGGQLKNSQRDSLLHQSKSSQILLQNQNDIFKVKQTIQHSEEQQNQQGNVTQFSQNNNKEQQSVQNKNQVISEKNENVNLLIQGMKELVKDQFNQAQQSFRQFQQKITESQLMQAQLNEEQKQQVYIIQEFQTQLQTQSQLIQTIEEQDVQYIVQKEKLIDIKKQNKSSFESIINLETEQQFNKSNLFDSLENLIPQIKKQNLELQQQQKQNQQNENNNNNQVEQQLLDDVSKLQIEDQYFLSLSQKLFSYLMLCQKIDQIIEQNQQMSVEQDSEILQQIFTQINSESKQVIGIYEFNFQMLEAINEDLQKKQIKMTQNEIQQVSQYIKSKISNDSSLLQEIILASRQLSSIQNKLEQNQQKDPNQLQIENIQNLENRKCQQWKRGTYDFFIILCNIIANALNKINNDTLKTLSEIIIQACNEESFDKINIKQNDIQIKQTEQVSSSCCCPCCSCCSCCCVIF